MWSSQHTPAHPRLPNLHRTAAAAYPSLENTVLDCLDLGASGVIPRAVAMSYA